MPENSSWATRKESPWKRRHLRIEWLLLHFDELHLGTYPWGLSRTDEKQNAERCQREYVIFRRMQEDGVISINTQQHDSNLNNLIVYYSTNGSRQSK